MCACEGIIDMFSNKRVRIIVTLGITQIHLYFLLKIRILLSNLYSSVYLILMFLFFFLKSNLKLIYTSEESK